jgi:hypothetical protein
VTARRVLDATAITLAAVVLAQPAVILATGCGLLAAAALEQAGFL